MPISNHCTLSASISSGYDPASLLRVLIFAHAKIKVRDFVFVINLSNQILVELLKVFQLSLLFLTSFLTEALNNLYKVQETRFSVYEKFEILRY